MYSTTELLNYHHSNAYVRLIKIKERLFKAENFKAKYLLLRTGYYDIKALNDIIDLLKRAKVQAEVEIYSIEQHSFPFGG